MIPSLTIFADNLYQLSSGYPGSAKIDSTCFERVTVPPYLVALSRLSLLVVVLALTINAHSCILAALSWRLPAILLLPWFCVTKSSSGKFLVSLSFFWQFSVQNLSPSNVLVLLKQFCRCRLYLLPLMTQFYIVPCLQFHLCH